MYNVSSFYLTEHRENQDGSSEKMLQNKKKGGGGGGRKTYHLSFRKRIYFWKNFLKTYREKLGRTCLEFKMLTNSFFRHTHKDN